MNAAADARDKGGIVGYEKAAHPRLPLQGGEQRDYSVPAFRVKAGHRLVTDEVFGVRRQGPGDRRPLPLAARKFVGIAGRLSRVKPRPFKKSAYAEEFSLPGSAPVGRAEIFKRFREGLPHRQPGIEGAARVLKDNLDPPAKFPQQGETRTRSVAGAAVKFNRTLAAALKAAEQPGQGRFPAAGFAQKPGDAALFDPYARPPERVKIPVCFFHV
jgi:hypothetical protein